MKKVLILGSSAQEYSLAKYLSKNNTVYVCPGNPSMSDFAVLVDIPDYNPAAIAEFVISNEISVTIPVSHKAVTAELVSIFTEKKLQMFAPAFDAASLFGDKLALIKLLYKLRIPVPRFASFDKASMAYDYIKNAKKPLLIKSNMHEYATVCVNDKIAKTTVDDLIFNDETVLIEEFVYGKTFTIYFLSDGYKALPLGTALNYNYSLEGDGGVLTNGIGACSPFYKLTDAHIDFLTTTVASSIIEYFEQQEKPFMGVFGLECIFTDDEQLIVTNLKYFFSDVDAQGILALLDIDFMKLVDDCLMGVFADIYEYIPKKDCNALSLVLSSKKDGEPINGLANLDENTYLTLFPLKKNKYLEYETVKGKNLLLTTTAGTISRARSLLYNEAEEISFDSKFYRKDIGAILSGNRGLV